VALPNEPDDNEINNVYVTSPNNGLWVYGYYAYGNARVSPNAPGIRIAKIINSTFFNSSNVSVYLSAVKGFNWIGGGVSYGAGPVATTGVWLSGGGTDDTNTRSIQFTGVNVNGQLNLSNTDTGRFSGILGDLFSSVPITCISPGTCGGGGVVDFRW
jgi:hypothetical protein